MNRLTKILRRLGSDQNGLAATEFGLLSIPFLVVVLGALDLGYQSYVRAQLQGVLNDVSRTATVENPVFAGYEGMATEAQIEEAIRDRVDLIARNATYTIQQTSFSQFSIVGDPEKLLTDIDLDGTYDASDGDCFEDANLNGTFDANSGSAGQGNANDVIFYEVTITMPRIVPVMGLLGVPSEYTINAQAAVRNQPYGAQPAPVVVCGP